MKQMILICYFSNQNISYLAKITIFADVEIDFTFLLNTSWSGRYNKIVYCLLNCTQKKFFLQDVGYEHFTVIKKIYFLTLCGIQNLLRAYEASGNGVIKYSKYLLVIIYNYIILYTEYLAQCCLEVNGVHIQKVPWCPHIYFRNQGVFFFILLKSPP